MDIATLNETVVVSDPLLRDEEQALAYVARLQRHYGWAGAILTVADQRAAAQRLPDVTDALLSKQVPFVSAAMHSAGCEWVEQLIFDGLRCDDELV